MPLAERVSKTGRTAEYSPVKAGNSTRQKVFSVSMLQWESVLFDLISNLVTRET